MKSIVTDAQYKEIQIKVSELEKKINLLSVQLSTLLLKGDVVSRIAAKTQSAAKKDITKYMFENQLYCKRRIAYICVKKYIEDNNISEYNEVLKAFPDYIQGSLGVIKPVEAAEKYSDPHRRFYFSDEDVICLSDKRYAICSQWEKKNIERLLSVAYNLGYKIEVVSFN